jgi:hypothetical protein
MEPGMKKPLSTKEKRAAIKTVESWDLFQTIMTKLKISKSSVKRRIVCFVETLPENPFCPTKPRSGQLFKIFSDTLLSLKRKLSRPL